MLRHNRRACVNDKDAASGSQVTEEGTLRSAGLSAGVGMGWLWVSVGSVVRPGRRARGALRPRGVTVLTPKFS